MRLRDPLLLIFGLLIAGQAANAFSVCRSESACNPEDGECCGWNCMPLLKSDCSSCSSPPCRCRKGACTPVHKTVERSGERGLRVLDPPAGLVKKRDAEKWPDILLIACFAVIIAVSLASGMLWAYLTFRDSRRLQQDEAVRKEEHRKAVQTASQASLTAVVRAVPVKRVSSKSSKEVVKA